MRHHLTGIPAVRYPAPVPALAVGQVWTSASGGQRAIGVIEGSRVCWHRPGRHQSRLSTRYMLSKWIRDTAATMTGLEPR